MLSADQVTRRFGEVTAVRELQLSVAAGEPLLSARSQRSRQPTINLFWASSPPTRGASPSAASSRR